MKSHNKVNLDNLRSQLLNSANDISRGLKFVQSLKLAQKFINSDTWKAIEPTSSGHDVIYQYFTQIFDGRKVMITDKGIVTHDNKNLYSDLTNEEKDFINKVDSCKEYGIFKYGRLYAMYIGTTVTTEDTAPPPQTYIFPDNTLCTITANAYVNQPCWFSGSILGFYYNGSYTGSISGLFVLEKGEPPYSIIAYGTITITS